MLPTLGGTTIGCSACGEMNLMGRTKVLLLHILGAYGEKQLAGCFANQTGWVKGMLCIPAAQGLQTTLGFSTACQMFYPWVFAPAQP